MISLNKIWLFKTRLVDPFFFFSTDGVFVSMSSERQIDTISVDNVSFLFDNVINGTASWDIRYGGEDDGASVSTGKSQMRYEITFEPPNFSLSFIDEIVGGEWSCVMETTGGQLLGTFARLTSETFSFDNDQKGEITLESEWSSSRIYLVNNFQAVNIQNTIDRTFVCDRINNLNFIEIT